MAIVVTKSLKTHFSLHVPPHLVNAVTAGHLCKIRTPAPPLNSVGQPEALVTKKTDPVKSKLIDINRYMTGSH